VLVEHYLTNGDLVTGCALVGAQPIPRWARPEDVVNVIDFFLRPESGMVTGQVIYLGGIG